MSSPRSKAPAVPAMHPREKLTRKARAAISQYAIIKSGDKPLYHALMVNAVLEAERMPRERLYAWLEEREYYWLCHTAAWVKARTPNRTEVQP